ncbi:MAG: site-2 protease family protein [Candidatus Pacebacteria bacterium]|nr:site-2 protease family protein [Candidatus Paceibacterota bacterium]
MILDFLLALIVFALIITIVVTAHELGHFWGAKKTKTKVTEFAVGFPPFIWKKQKGETLFGIGIIPFGGYNKIYGESVEAKDKSDPASYTSKKTREKLLIIVSGVIGNFILSIILFYIVLMPSHLTSTIGLINPDYKFPLGYQENYLMINYVEEGSPANYGGLNKDDIILAINGERIKNANELKETLNSTKGEALAFLVENRKTKEKSTHIIANMEEKIGIGYSNIAELSYNTNLKDKIFAGVFHTYNFTSYSMSTLGNMIAKSFAAKDISIAGNAVAGPVGIFAITKVSLSEGFLYMLNITAIISLALAVTNLLPLPALDGGKCIYLVLQKLRPRFFTDELSEKIDGVGFIALMALGVLIVVKDVFQFKDLIF